MLYQPSRLAAPFSAAEACKSSHGRADCSVDIGSGIQKEAAFRDPSISLEGRSWEEEHARHSTAIIAILVI
jgi:hypothetical protein